MSEHEISGERLEELSKRESLLGFKRENLVLYARLEDRYGEGRIWATQNKRTEEMLAVRAPDPGPWKHTINKIVRKEGKPASTMEQCVRQCLIAPCDADLNLNTARVDEILERNGAVVVKLFDILETLGQGEFDFDTPGN